MKDKKSKVLLKGNKKDGFIIIVFDGKEEYHDGIYRYEELVELLKILKKSL